MTDHLPSTYYLDPEMLQKLGDLELIAREAVEGLRVGSHRSQLKGFSTEFAHHRQYVPGDALRTIDWRVFGRTERLYTKLYEAETNFDCHLLIDASASMNYGSGKVSKLEYTKYLAASLGYIVLKQRDSLGLTIFDSEVRAYLPPRSTMSMIVEIDRLLREIKPMPRTTLAKQLQDTVMMIKRRSLIVVISDLLADVDEVLAGLDHLRFCGHNVVVLQTLDPYELTFPFKGTWQFDGLEQEDPLTTQPDRIREDYLKNIGQFLEGIRAGCIAGGIDYALVDTSRPLDAILAEFFETRQTTTLGSASASSRL